MLCPQRNYADPVFFYIFFCIKLLYSIKTLHAKKTVLNILQNKLFCQLNQEIKNIYKTNVQQKKTQLNFNDLFIHVTGLLMYFGPSSSTPKRSNACWQKVRVKRVQADYF